jgi:hypothetical protein
MEEETYFWWRTLLEIVHLETLDGDKRVVRWSWGDFELTESGTDRF